MAADEARRAQGPRLRRLWYVPLCANTLRLRFLQHKCANSSALCSELAGSKAAAKSKAAKKNEKRKQKKAEETSVADVSSQLQSVR